MPPGRVTAIVGANACGKSTLLRAMARLLRPTAGRSCSTARSSTACPRKEVARTLGTAAAVADRARGHHRRPTSSAAAAIRTRAAAPVVGRGRPAVAEALELTDTVDLADRAVDELSGGQRQRVWIAMALAQQTDLLLLDEPTTFLDVTHQVEVLDLLTDLNRARGTTIVMVLHDLNLAARYADHLVALHDGRGRGRGGPSEVLTEEVVARCSASTRRVVADPVSDTPLVVPIGRHHRKDTP